MALVYVMLGVSSLAHAQHGSVSGENYPDHVEHYEIDLYDAVRKSVRQHPGVRGALGSLESSRQSIGVARSYYYPQVSGGLGADYNRYRNGRYDEKYLHNINLNVTQVVYDFGKTSHTVDKAEHAASAAQAYTELTVEQVARQAARALIEAERYGRLSELASSQVEQVRRLTDLVKQREQKGASTLSDVLQARSRLGSILAQQVSLDNQRDAWLRDLALLIGYETNVSGVSIGEPPATLDQICLTEVDPESSHEILIAQFNEQQAAADLDLAEAQSFPTLQLQAQASRPLNASPNYGGRNDASINLNFSMPFYQGGGLSASKRAAAGALQAARAETAHTHLRVMQQMAELSSRYRGMQGQTRILEDRVRNIQGTRQLYWRQYLDLGTRSLLDLLNAEQEYHQAQIELANNELDLLQTKLDCAFHKGGWHKHSAWGRLHSQSVRCRFRSKAVRLSST